VVRDDDVTPILQALFDIRTELRRIRAIIERGDEDDEEGREEEDS
jgi:hypothetical protein